MDACTPVAIAAQSSTPVLVLTAGNRRLDAYDLFNSGNAVAYLQCFDAKQVSDVTLGTTAPTLTIPVPTGGKAALANVRAAFLKGLVIAATAGPANAVAPNASMVVNLGVR